MYSKSIYFCFKKRGQLPNAQGYMCLVSGGKVWTTTISKNDDLTLLLQEIQRHLESSLNSLNMFCFVCNKGAFL